MFNKYKKNYYNSRSKTCFSKLVTEYTYIPFHFERQPTDKNIKQVTQ